MVESTWARDWMNQQVENLIRAEYARLEAEGKILIEYGYAPSELTIAQYPSGFKEVLPLSAVG